MYLESCPPIPTSPMGITLTHGTCRHENTGNDLYSTAARRSRGSAFPYRSSSTGTGSTQRRTQSGAPLAAEQQLHGAVVRCARSERFSNHNAATKMQTHPRSESPRSLLNLRFEKDVRRNASGIWAHTLGIVARSCPPHRRSRHSDGRCGPAASYFQDEIIFISA